MSEAGNWLRVASTNDVEEGAVLGVEVNGRSVAVYHLEGDEWYATDNVCTHAFATLSDGWLEDGVIECPLHAGRFDVRTGKGLCAPIEEDLKTYPVRIEGGEVLVQL
jgi:MocE subfamily Rieske [2Fe-2S] domain protein